MIQRILLENQNDVFKDYYVELAKDVILELGQINLFIGANNSGKSRLLREIFKSFVNRDSMNLPFSGTKENSLRIHLIQVNLVSGYFSHFKDLFLNDLNNEQAIEKLREKTDIFLNTLKNKERDFITEYEANKAVEFVENIINEIILIEYPKSKNVNIKVYDSVFEMAYAKIKTYFEDFKTKTLAYIPKDKENLITTFIPPYRSLRKFGSAKIEEEKYFNNRKKISGFDYFTNNVLKDRLCFDYFDNEYENVFTGEDLYNKVKELRNSKEEERQKLVDFEVFLSDTFFSGQKVQINAITHNNEDDIYLKIGNEKEFPIFNLGDGIQSIIILTFPLFTQKDLQNYLFIEEPELFLHAGMQRIFIDTLKRFPQTQVFITTHSNHLLDLTLDSSKNMSVFTINKHALNPKRMFEIRKTNEQSLQILDLLGVRNSSVLLSNCSIWVEGISERLYFRQFLNLYQDENPDSIKNFKKYREDINYSFIEYSGGNITHWSFLNNSDNDFPNIKYSSISNRVFLITDKDTGKELRHENLNNSLGENYYCLGCLEIENLLMPTTLKKTLEAYKRKTISEINFLKDFEIEDYKDKPIADFIYEIVSIEDITKLASISEEKQTGKIYNKAEFTKNAIRNINSWSELSEEAKNLTRLIYKFINRNN